MECLSGPSKTISRITIANDLSLTKSKFVNNTSRNNKQIQVVCAKRDKDMERGTVVLFGVKWNQKDKR